MATSSDGLWLLDPDARLDFAFDWSDWLDTSETISEHTITVGAGVTVDGDSTELDGLVTFWLKDGQAGTRPLIECRIVTSAGREDDRSKRVTIKQR